MSRDALHGINGGGVNNRQTMTHTLSSHTACCPLPAARSPRHGISLIEVLVAMGVLALGLLGAAALFPVGGYYMQTGDVADRSDAIAQAALNDAVTRGWLNPKNWAAYDINSGGPGRSRFRRTIASRASELVGAGVSIQAACSDLGYAYVIDPVGVASCGTDLNLWAENEYIGYFPITSFAPDFASLNSATPGTASWQPWVSGTTNLWPVRRVTVRQRTQQANNSPIRVPVPMMGELAFQSSMSTDDLALDLPSKADLPSQQRYTNRNGTPVQRTARQNLSWAISVVPTNYEAFRGLTSSPDSFTYDVSAVIFNKRVAPAPLSTSAPGPDPTELDTNQSLLAGGERTVRAKVVSTGVNGGELLLEAMADWRASDDDWGANPESPFKELKAGQWIMLCGPHVLSSNVRPMLFMQWYKVLAVEEVQSDSPYYQANLEKRVVSLRGPDWPWQSVNDLTDNTILSNDLRVGIFPSIVAVHTKTMRLEAGSEWSVE
jgi:Tfp pilus assembly protein PilV